MDMNREEALRKAYFVLGLEPGASLETINRRYKRLIMVWHPDRLHTDSARQEAEEEVKKINNARDTLIKHFETRHNSDSPCACKPEPKTTQQTSDAAKQANEAARKAQEAARKKQEEAKAAQEAVRKTQEAARKKQEEAIEREKKEKEAKLGAASKAVARERARWFLTPCLAAAWLVVILFSWCWECAHPYYGSTPIADTIPPPIDPAVIKRQELEELRRTQEATWIKKSDDIRSALGEVDSYQMVVEDSTKSIARYEAQIADPGISDAQRGKLLGFQNGEKARLADAQARLIVTQKEVAALEADVTAPVGEVEMKKKKDDDTYVTNLAIRLWQTEIDQFPTLIASLETQLANPSVSHGEKQNLVGCRDSLRKLFSQAQENLPIAQKKLADIGGKS
jgi:hypothetical protein